MTRTEAYTRMHRALMVVSREFGQEPHLARVLLAVHEVGGGDGATTDQLYDALGVEPGSQTTHAAQTRRALVKAYEADLALGTGPHGGPRKKGSNTLVRLTFDGARLVQRVLDEAEATL